MKIVPPAVKPVVRVHPDKNVFRGEKVTLTCDIQQTGDWQYIWDKEGYVKSAEQNQSYIISSVDQSHSGVYSCRVSQSNAQYHSESSDGVKLTVSEKPKPVVRVHPDKNVFRGEKVTLTCDIEQTRDWQYSWNKNGKPVKSAGRDQNYTITPVYLSHDVMYSCYGALSNTPHQSDPYQSESSDGVKLTVSDKLQPTLTVNPQSSVFTGDTVTLSCDVGQSTGWTIHWRKDSNPESTDAATKTIESVSVSDGGRYWCKAQRGEYYSEFSNTAEITVKDLTEMRRKLFSMSPRLRPIAV
ncbi:Killer cell immunoglobulin-like receptor 3DL1 [Labeo rohita]|uniref:Killer cell immunoglobulin-like receptor 3DL1 n=1 Tax=Labeo rohita TaxID=84645 RepID=A0ABQ8L6V8_LABRO|nr:Killer cell immunoglobulin-like receptor 3DL1 [Labeo rohita]